RGRLGVGAQLVVIRDGLWLDDTVHRAKLGGDRLDPLTIGRIIDRGILGPDDHGLVRRTVVIETRILQDLHAVLRLGVVGEPDLRGGVGTDRAHDYDCGNEGNDPRANDPPWG